MKISWYYATNVQMYINIKIHRREIYIFTNSLKYDLSQNINSWPPQWWACVSWDFYICLSPKRSQTILWCHKVWLYSLYWSLTMFLVSHFKDGCLWSAILRWLLYSKPSPTVSDQHNEYNIVWHLFGCKQTS